MENTSITIPDYTVPVLGFRIFCMPTQPNVQLKFPLFSIYGYDSPTKATDIIYRMYTRPAPLRANYLWQPNVYNTAFCARQDLIRGKQLVAVTKKPVMTHPKNREIPDVRCSCGFYALNTYKGAMQERSKMSRDGEHFYHLPGIVSAVGTLISKGKGFRAEKMKVEALVVPNLTNNLHYRLKDIYAELCDRTNRVEVPLLYSYEVKDFVDSLGYASLQNREEISALNSE